MDGPLWASVSPSAVGTLSNPEKHCEDVWLELQACLARCRTPGTTLWGTAAMTPKQGAADTLETAAVETSLSKQTRCTRVALLCVPAALRPAASGQPWQLAHIWLVPSAAHKTTWSSPKSPSCYLNATHVFLYFNCLFELFSHARHLAPSGPIKSQGEVASEAQRGSTINNASRWQSWSLSLRDLSLGDALPGAAEAKQGAQGSHVCTEEGSAVRPPASSPEPRQLLLSATAAGLAVRTSGRTDPSRGWTPSHPLLSPPRLPISSHQLTALPQPS